MSSTESPIILALDRLDRAAAEALAERVAGRVHALKVHDLYLQEGPALVAALKRHAPVWVDLKFHDIPATVAAEVRRLVDAGVDFCTIHASGGPDMCEAAVEAGGRERIIAVTVLTSLEELHVRNIYGADPTLMVPQLGRIAASAGVGSIVCSPLEAKLLADDRLTATCNRITPGVRPEWYLAANPPKDDQARTATPAQALADGATHLVIGRPIVQADDPSAALNQTLSEIGAGA
jgi:orotidine-5'-phosphate decarboxylase